MPSNERKAYTVYLDTETWELLGRMAKAFGLPKSRVIDMCVLERYSDSVQNPKPQRHITLFPEDK